MLKDTNDRLYQQVTYAGVPYPINLEDSRAVKLTVEQDDADPVIKVDNGKVHALREGTAVIVADYAGAGDPHAHDWGQPDDGSAPTASDRGTARPVQPSNPKPNPNP